MNNVSAIPMDDISNLNEYVSILKSSKNIVSNKINELESEYISKLSFIESLCLNKHELQDIITKPSLKILEYEVEIIKILTKYTLQNKILNHSFFLSALKALFVLSESLRKRLGQKEIIHGSVEKDNSSIYRCSYKFCSYHCNCIYNYNKTTKNLCYQDHYVHNMVSADISILIQYINNKCSDGKILQSKEILKTINTLSFVISHMEKELKGKCLYLPESQWEQFHYVKYIKQ
jgi:hypothetical protein